MPTPMMATADLVVLVSGPRHCRSAVGRRDAVAVGAQVEVPFDVFPTDPTPSLTAGYRSEAGCASRLSSLRTCRIRCKTVIGAQPCQHVDGRRQGGPGRRTRYRPRITTRTARLAMPTLHSTPSGLGAGACVAHHQRREHGHDDGGGRDLVAVLGEDVRHRGAGTMPSSMRSSVEFQEGAELRAACPTCASSARRACRTPIRR